MAYVEVTYVIQASGSLHAWSQMESKAPHIQMLRVDQGRYSRCCQCWILTPCRAGHCSTSYTDLQLPTVNILSSKAHWHGFRRQIDQSKRLKWIFLIQRSNELQPDLVAIIICRMFTCIIHSRGRIKNQYSTKKTSGKNDKGKYWKLNGRTRANGRTL